MRPKGVEKVLPAPKEGYKGHGQVVSLVWAELTLWPKAEGNNLDQELNGQY